MTWRQVRAALAAVRKKTVAAVVTEYRHWSHADDSAVECARRPGRGAAACNFQRRERRLFFKLGDPVLKFPFQSRLLAKELHKKHAVLCWPRALERFSGKTVEHARVEFG